MAPTMSCRRGRTGTVVVVPVFTSGQEASNVREDKTTRTGYSKTIL
jgi:hypothetical protein